MGVIMYQKRIHTFIKNVVRNLEDRSFVPKLLSTSSSSTISQIILQSAISLYSLDPAPYLFRSLSHVRGTCTNVGNIVLLSASIIC